MKACTLRTLTAIPISIPILAFPARAALSHFLTHPAFLWAAFGLLAELAIGFRPAQAAVTEAWVHRYNNLVNNANDHAAKVVRDAVGDIIVTGNSDGYILTIKYSGADGSVVWQKRYSSPAGNYLGIASAIAVDGSGNVLVTGPSYNGPPNYDYEYYTAKYAAADGALLWEKRYNGGSVDYGDFAQAVAVDGSGNAVVTGYSYGGASSWDYYTAKYAAADGALLWEKRSNIGEYAYAVVVDGSGNVVVTGTSNNGNGADYYTVKYAAENGALLWEKRYNGSPNSDDYPRAVAVDASGNVVVTGVSFNSGATFAYSYTAKYAASGGALLWEKRYTNSVMAIALAVDGSGNVVVTGYSSNTNGNADYYTAKYAAADGALLWEQRYSGPNSLDQAKAVAVDGSGNVVVTGVSYNVGGTPEYYTAKYAAADGALLWEKLYDGHANWHDDAQAVTVDSSGNVVVTGSSYNTNLISDYYTAKYAAADGALLWEKLYDGPPRNLGDVGQAVALDGDGNVVVTGYSDNGSNYDYYTAKYATANGALLWEQRYNGPANSLDQARAVVVDGSGNVVVTGLSNDSSTNADYYTAKYAAANGALLWEQRSTNSVEAMAMDSGGNMVVTGSSYNGTNDDYYTAKYAAVDGALLWEMRYNGLANGEDQARAVAVDGDGNAAVTGYSYTINTADPDSDHWYFHADYYTAKYAAADGTLLWEKRFDGPGNRNDQANAVAVDGSGNVVVTGYSYYTNFDADYYTAKYAATDGTLLWEQRYDGPGNSEDQAKAVAVDGSGNVVVTGLSRGSSSNAEYYTAKYAAVDGALLWEQRSTNSVEAVAFDNSGNVVVTGSSYNGTNNDYYTAKYAARDGTLLWEKRYNGPANGPDSASSLALGPNGMVAVTGSSSGDYATVVYRENLPPISIDLVPTGIRLCFTGVPGRSYNIERAPAVTGPWSTFATPIAPPGGLVEYVDNNSPAGTAYYRTSTP